MPTQITPLFEPTDEAAVRDLEQKLKAQLPADYRAFLLAYNGGSARPNVFAIGDTGNESAVSVLFGIIKDRSYDLWSNMLRSWDDDDSTFLPIGRDPGGNQICIDLAPQELGRVFFRNHELELPDALTPIAASFTEFLEGLHELA
jgi:cell wall assembly regulator SMI1